MFNGCHRCSFRLENVFLYLTINVTRELMMSVEYDDEHRHGDDEDWFHTYKFSLIHSNKTQLNQRDSPSNISFFFLLLLLLRFRFFFFTSTTKYSSRKKERERQRERGKKRREERQSERSVHRTQVKRERWRENVCNFLVRLFLLCVSLFFFLVLDFFLYK